MNKLKLNDKLKDILLYVIGTLSTNQFIEEKKILTKDYVSRLSTYLRSIGQYGDTPMLVPLWSSSEFPQAFARTSCVLQSIYIVNTLFTIDKVNVEEKKFKSVNISIDPNPICADNLLYGGDYAKLVLPEIGSTLKVDERFVLQMICIVSKPIIGTSNVILTNMLEITLLSYNTSQLFNIRKQPTYKNIPKED